MLDNSSIPSEVQPAGSGQRGAALIVSLILLLVMTVIGLSSMLGAVEEVKMAGTMRAEEVALRRAEASLLTAEDAIEAMIANAALFEFSTAGDGYYLQSANINPRAIDWSALDSQPGPHHTDNSVDDDDQFIIEYRGERVITGESRAEGKPPIAGSVTYLYRNISRSAENPHAVRIIESMYATDEKP